MKTKVTPEELWALIGTSNAPHVVDVCLAEDAAEIGAIVPTAKSRKHTEVDEWAPALDGKPVAVICQKGLKLSEGVAAILRLRGIDACNVDGGVFGWRDAGLPMVPVSALPPRVDGKTRWVTRARPKIDRIACPWLIRRFVDPHAEFLFVDASQVSGVAGRFNATPFDIDGVYWSHRGETCTFDTMVEQFGLATPALLTLATIVRGADTARLDLAPQCAGLLAVSLGLSRNFQSDLQQLEAGMAVYDALYAWARDGQGETHNWPSQVPA